MHAWIHTSIRKITADYQRSADTHLIKLELPALPGVDLYLKDESTHPTGSLEHRLARSLFLYALYYGKTGSDTTVIEASSGSTAVSETYFARMIGVPFVAVMPTSTAHSKIELIKLYGGQCHFVDNGSRMHGEAIRLAESLNGHFLDQFTYAEQATDWRGNNNIAESIFCQMQQEPHPIPRTIVMSAGTGGTSATIGRYIRYVAYDTELLVVDPENSIFHASFVTGDLSLTTDRVSRIEGIGRPVVEHSFRPNVIDRMLRVPDAASIASIHWPEQQTGRKAGRPTGTNLRGALQVAREMRDRAQEGSIVTQMCDDGERYLDTCYDKEWGWEEIGDMTPFTRELATPCEPVGS